MRRLNELLAAPRFIEDIEYITGIENLLYDAQLEGGGMHVTGPRGRLDVGSSSGARSELVPSAKRIVKKLIGRS